MHARYESILFSFFLFDTVKQVDTISLLSCALQEVSDYLHVNSLVDKLNSECLLSSTQLHQSGVQSSSCEKIIMCIEERILLSSPIFNHFILILNMKFSNAITYTFIPSTFKINSLSRFAQVLMLLLLLAGDVEKNPGPGGKYFTGWNPECHHSCISSYHQMHD